VSVTASLSAGERAELLAEVRHHLPAFLHGRTTEQQDPAGDVRELLNLEEDDLGRVIAVHKCLDEAVLAFGASLGVGLRHPIAGSTPRPTVSRSVRGPVDWARTAKRRAQVPGEPASFVIPEQGAVFDTPENRAVVWLLGHLEAEADSAAAHWKPTEPEAGEPDPGWRQKIDLLRVQLAEARGFPWLRAIPAEQPTPAVLRRLGRARSGFYAERVAPAASAVLRLTDYSPETLTEVLSARYFGPESDGTLFEIAVALRLARAFRELSPRPRRTRLLMGDGRSSFARYGFDDGSEVRLAYQAWPDDKPTMRRELIGRHGFRSPRNAVPDIIVIRTGTEPDAVILELKASHDSAYLRKGLVELSDYLADRPDLWGPQPAGWLVAPTSEAFADEVADAGFPLWIVSANQVAAAAAARFTPAT